MRFKLLILETRGGENEILATQFLKQLNFISPETFSVDVAVNGTLSTMLFQENAVKELLEKNLRREGAIFEGDEELLWSYKDFDLLALAPLSLSRLTNPNWFQKGSSSQEIALAAFSQLQNSYLRSVQKEEYHHIEPNVDNSKFEEFAFALLVMNAEHAMANHNRKYYYNAISGKFEPIYYDGNANFSTIEDQQSGLKLQDYIAAKPQTHITYKFISKLQNLLKSPNLKLEFLNRSQNLEIDAESFYDVAIDHTLKNISVLEKKMKSLLLANSTTASLEFVQDYIDDVDNLGLEQLVFVGLEKAQIGYKGTLDDGEKINLSTSDVVELISKNSYQGKRSVLLNVANANLWRKTQRILIESFNSDIYISDGITFTVSDETKTLHFSQTNPTDWVLISGGNLAGWLIKFDGKAINDGNELSGDQRFNSFGLTGCLTFFETELDNITVNVLNGGCEDSLNIISSSGIITSLQIDKAFADAIDMDFSNVTIKNALIKNAGNDCYDVSTGTYKIVNGHFEMCRDKGISVGEGSSLHADSLRILGANIGISSKDYSKVTIDTATFSNVITCVEAKQKKQEFGGASADLKKMDCNGGFEIDQHSTVEVGGNEL